MMGKPPGSAPIVQPGRPMAKRKLADYQAKRDFAKTAEPRGTVEVGRAEYPRFVVQKHDATRLHYDLRLEHDGVFKSWAVTKGPSLDPADKRLAVEVEDHPLAYGDFEGTIPAGEYGGGTVQLWDRGFWLPDGGEDVDAALRKGELKFTLAGSKLKGSFVLVRMKADREGGKRNNWLLIKHRDAFASKRDVAGKDKSVASGRSMAQIAAGKGRGPKPFMAEGAKVPSPKAIWHSGRAKGAPAKAAAERHAPAFARSARTGAGGPMPKFVTPQLCTTLTRPPQGNDWVHEIKFDGYRLQLRVEAGTAQLLTRNGLDWTDRFRPIAEAAAGLPDAIVDGEVVALDDAGAPDFAALQAALSDAQPDDLVYFAFDLLFERGEDLRNRPLAERKQRLEALLGKARSPDRVRYVEHLHGDGDAVLQSARRMQLEGIISKRLGAPYTSGRSKTWTKCKCRAGHEVVIGGWSGNSTTLRSLVAGVYRGDHLVHVGQVGTGFNARNTRELLRQLNAHATPESPFGGAGAPRKQAGWHWVEPVLVAEIEFAGWTGAGMIRQSAFKGLRLDKPAREVRAEQPVAPEQAVIAAPRAPAAGKGRSTVGGKTRGTTGGKAGPTVIMGVTISHPDKALWPGAPGGDAPVSKRDLAAYLEQVGAWMIEHLRGRPCSVIRAPDGIDGQTFFQRHAMPGVSDLIELTTVEGDRKPYLQIDRIEGLIAMAQIAAVEFHPWNCAPDQPARPGRLVFDLDPAPDVDFSAVVAAARELRERLERIGLVAFCKTTGGKGLHVVTPLKVAGRSELGWAQAKSFAEAVCAQMAHDSPEKFLITMAKKQRTGRIFLDYLRNDRMATAVAPLSPRARAGAPVSMPIGWNQVRAGLDPQRFTIRTVPALLANSRAWADYGEAERPLEDAIRKLVGRKLVGRKG